MSARTLLFLYVLSLPFACFAADGTLYVSPETGTYSIGDTFQVQVLADTGGQAINAAEAEINFNPQMLEVENIAMDGSILKSWPTPPTYKNDIGTIQFAGWTNANYTGQNGLLVTVTFKALRNMAGNAYLAAGALLAADGRGSNIITSMKSGTYDIQPKQIVDDTTSGILSLAPPENTDSTSSPEAFAGDQNGPLITPTLTDYPTNIQAGDRIIIRGKTNANSRLSIWVEKGDDPAVDSSIMSAADGSFVYVSDQGVENDTLYRVWAEVHSQNDVQSAISKKITLMVQPVGIAAVAAASWSLLGSILPLLLLLIIGGLGFGYLYHLRGVERWRRGDR